MVREGLDTVPPVKRAREPIFNVAVTPLIVLVHVMEETGGSAETMHTSSTAPPKFTLYEFCAICSSSILTCGICSNFAIVISNCEFLKKIIILCIVEIEETQ